tara:strand:- start:104 stop:421 length:318 start_codon:yes stop_codon:yes gene_type:complete
MGIAAAAVIVSALAAGESSRQQRAGRKSAKHGQERAGADRQKETAQLEADRAAELKKEESRAVVDKNRARKKLQGGGSAGRAGTIKTGATTGTSTTGGTKSLLGL